MDTDLHLPNMDEVDYLAGLLLKQLRQEITEEELQLLENWKAAHPSHAQVCEQVNDGDQLLADLIAMKQIDVEGWWQKISEQAGIVKKPAPFYQRWYSYAAAAMVLIIAGAIIWQYKQPAAVPQQGNEKQAPVIADKLPVGNKAFLTLSNGTTIDLDNVGNGKVAQEESVAVVKAGDGQLQYELVGNSAIKEEAINILQTPKGGQYQVTLPDGSKVWLNTASSIKYPTRFTGRERRVAITGEVYFEVAKSGKTKQPFIVAVQSPAGKELAGVEVTGTKFDIMAYEDEAAIRTSLLTGKVKVSIPWDVKNKHNAIKYLVPGQQAQIPHPAVVTAGSSAIKVIDMTAVEEVLGWKSGLVYMKNTDLKELLRIVARWYNIEVEYQGQIPTYIFNGTLLLKQNLSLVLQFLEYEGVHFKLQQSKLVIMP